MGSHITFASQCRELTQVRAENDWIREGSATSLNHALMDLDRAYDRFFKGAGYPTMRRRGVNDSIYAKGCEVAVKRLNAKWSAIKFPKIGWLKFRDTRDRPRIQNAIISRCGEQWFVSIQCDVGEARAPSSLPSVGVDRGVAQTITLSNGEAYTVPAMGANWKRLAKAQRVLARRKRGSKRYDQQRDRVAALKGKAGRIRRDFLHRVSTDVVQRFGLVALEDLNIPNMTASGRGKHGLNRSILDQGWAMFGVMLAYKLESNGGRLVMVNPAFTSQTCSACGVIDKRSRKSQAVFHCVACGHRDNADTNAAIEIRRRSTALLRGEGQTTGPANREPAIAA